MTGRTFAILTAAGFLATVIASKVQNQYMVVPAFCLLLLPSIAVVIQSEIRK